VALACSGISEEPERLRVIADEQALGLGVLLEAMYDGGLQGGSLRWFSW
jgi:hypothetical protein